MRSANPADTANRRRGACLLLLCLALVLSACGPGAGHDDDGLSVVASTNVYGDVVRSIAGDRAAVTSIITDPGQDPHEYEASARDRLAIDRADVVVHNGGGYDPFVERMIDRNTVVLDAVEISGLASELDSDEHTEEQSSRHSHGEHGDGKHSHGEHGDGKHSHGERSGRHHHVPGFNEHVWYDVHTMQFVAEQVRDELSELDPDNADFYAANFDTFAEQLSELETAIEALCERAEGTPVVVTEPVPLYLLAEAGLVDRTPEGFSEAIEEGGNVSPRLLRRVLDVLGEQRIGLLAENFQTSDATTDRVSQAARDAEIPVVKFSETLPPGMSYIQWQEANIDAIDAALRSVDTAKTPQRKAP